MKKDKALFEPLSDDEIEWLDDFLWMVYHDYQGMPLETVDGLFCALSINPEAALPSEWLATILGESFEFDSDEEAEKIIALLFCHWNQVNHLIQNRPKSKDAVEVYLPLIFDQDDEITDEEFGEQWAIGFHVGIDYCHDAWSKAVLKDEDLAQMLSPILLLELGYNPDNDNEVITYEKRKELYQYLPLVVYSFYDYWKEDRSQNLPPSQQKTTIKIGRNEPCPCGSGKKYKKCCYGKVSQTIH